MLEPLDGGIDVHRASPNLVEQGAQLFLVHCFSLYRERFDGLFRPKYRQHVSIQISEGGCPGAGGDFVGIAQEVGASIMQFLMSFTDVGYRENRLHCSASRLH
jgi:hypothetical protein